MHGARIRTIAALIGAALASLAGCGGTTSSPTAGAHWVVPSAAIASPSIGETVDAVTLYREARQAMYDAGSCEVTTTGGAMQMHGQMRLKSGGVDASMLLQLGEKTIALRLLSETVYLEVHELLPGKTWVKVSRTGKQPLSLQLGGILGGILETLRLLSEPTAFFISPQTLTVMGTAQVDGITTTEYADGTVMTAEEAARLSAPDDRSQASAMTGAALRFEEFIDADHLPRRVVLQITQQDGTQVTMAAEYSNWGVPVTVTAPPESDVTDLTKPSN